MGTGLTLFIAFLVIWYSVTLVAAFLQEGKVGWPHFGRKMRMFFFICGMLASGSVQQLVAFPYSLLVSKKASRKFAMSLQRGFFSWFAPNMWGKIQMEGIEHLPDGSEPCIYVANHQSSVDFTLSFLLPTKPHVIGVAKESMILLPGFGLMTYLAGGIFISRGKKGVMASMLEQATERIASGVSIGLFPQGTRSVSLPGKEDKPFKIGAFVLATKTKTRVVPLSFIYPEGFMEPGGSPTGEPLKVIVHSPVDPGEDAEKLKDKVESIIMTPVRKAAEKMKKPASDKASDKKPASDKKKD